jgi:hypothetical protein
MTPLFCTLDSQRIADLIRSAERFVCYAGPGMQMAPAQAMAEVAGRLGVEMVTVALDFDERVMRMGFGDMQAVRTLREAGIRVNDAPGLRTALVLVDDEGYLFTPTALYLEAEPQGQQAANAMRLSTDQLREALARLSPVAKAIAVAQAATEQEREHIASLPVEVSSEPVTDREGRQAVVEEAGGRAQRDPQELHTVAGQGSRPGRAEIGQAAPRKPAGDLQGQPGGPPEDRRRRVAGATRRLA